MRLPSTHGIKRSVLVKKRSSNSIQENSEPIQTRWKKDNVEKSSNKINLSNAISQRWPQTFLDYIKTRLSIVCSGRKIEENNCYFCQYYVRKFWRAECFFSCLIFLFFFYIFQENVRWALWTKKKSFLLFRVFWRALYGVAMCISERKLKNTECIDQIKRGISLVKVCLTCKNHATFLENSELFITRAFSISGV